MRGATLSVLLLIGSSAFCQTPAKEPDTLQQLLSEVHQLRKDLEAVTIASQRVQIALYSLQIQDTAVARATLRLDEVRKKCAAVENERLHLVSLVQDIESAGPGKIPEPELKAMRDQIGQFKRDAEMKSTESQNCQATESQTSGQLRSEQAKLTELQERIGRLDKALDKLAPGLN